MEELLAEQNSRTIDILTIKQTVRHTALLSNEEQQNSEKEAKEYALWH